MRGMPDAELEELAAAIAVARHRPGPGRPHPGAAEPGRRRVRAASSARASTTGAASRRSPPTTSTPSAPGRRSTSSPTAPPRRASRCANASPSTRSSSSAASPGWTPACCRTSARSPTRRPASPWRTRPVAGRPWQEPEEGFTAASPGRTDLHRTIDTEGRTADRRDDFDEVYGDWEALREAGRPRHGPRPDRRRRAAALARRRRRPDPADRRRGAGPAARRRPGAGRAVPDRRRRCAATTVGDDVTYIVTRNINFTNVCYTGCRFCAFAQRRTDADAYTLSLAQVADRAAAGVGGRRGRGLHAGRHPPRPARHRVLRHRAGGQGAGARACTCTPSRRWRSSTARPAPACRSATG